jgi:hypothetical protein
MHACAGLRRWPGRDCARMDCWLSSPQWRGMAEQRSCRPVQVSMVWAQWRSDCECLWIASLAGLKGPPGGVEIMQAFAGLCMPERQRGLWMSVDYQFGRPKGLVLLEIVWVWGVGVWGSVALVGLRSRPKDQRSHSLQSSGLWAYGVGLGMQCWLFF